MAPATSAGRDGAPVTFPGSFRADLRRLLKERLVADYLADFPRDTATTVTPPSARNREPESDR